MRILVTGNRGYLGAVLCRRLLEEGMEVVGLDTDFYRGCNLLALGYTVKQLSGDIREVKKSDLEGVDAIIHLAALSNDPIGALNSALTLEINYLASVSLAKLARESKVKKFIFSSSCSVYGISDGEMIDENGLLDPVTAYARSKVETEKEITKLADETFCPVFLRNATVYGVSPMLRVDLVVNNLLGWAFTSGKIKIMSDGSPWRPLIHIRDICEAFVACLKAPKESVHNQVFNVGRNSENYRVRDIADIVKKILPACNIEYTGEHGADSRNYRVNFNKFSRVLGDFFKPQWNVEKGVRELLDAYKQANLSKEDFQGDKFIRLKRIEKLLRENRVDGSLFWKTGGNDD